MKLNRLFMSVCVVLLTLISLQSRYPLFAEIDPATAVALQTITDDPNDRLVKPVDRPEPYESDFSVSTAQSSIVINLDDFRADARFAGIDGSGVAVVVIDTGIDVDHPFFGPDNDNNNISDRIVYQYDFVDNDDDASDVHGHGSNVSSIVGSSDATHTGMAPDVNLIHLKVLGDNGSGSFSAIENALQWVVANATTYNIVSINMSLGDDGNYSTSQIGTGIDDEIAAIRTLGVAVVSASGNDFNKHGSVQGVSYPAADPNSMAVGAVYDANIGSVTYHSSGAVAFSTGPDRVTPFSQRHQTLSTIFAPGAAIVGAGPTGGTTINHGTSQAAPHIAGIVALMQELALQEMGRMLTVDEIEALLVNTADLVFDGDDEDDNVTNSGLNFPRVDVMAIGEAILTMAGTDSVPPQVALVNSTADSGDGALSSGEVTNAEITAVHLTFSEAMNDPLGNSEANDVTNPANYMLLSAGEDGDFETAVCPTAQGNDVAIPINAVSYSDGSFEATLTLNGGVPLPSDMYRLLACGSTTLEDEAGNPLDGDGNGTGGDEFQLQFTVDRVGPTISLISMAGQTAVDNGTVVANITTIQVQFDEAMNDPAGDSDPGDVTNPANYRLIADGANDLIETPICGAVAGDDTAVLINAVSYSAGMNIATLLVNGGNKLPADGYRLAVCGSGTLQDEAGNYFYDGSDEFALSFTVETPTEYLLFLPIVTD